MLIARGLVKRFGGRTALDGFDLHVAPGEIVGLLGRNGAGKTTFVEVVTGLVRPDAGEVRLAGLDALSRRREVRAKFGVALQETALYPPLTPVEHLRLFGALSGLRRRALASAMERISAELLLTGVMDRPVGLLSGGQRRRVQAACALLTRPPLLLLDEPTAGADPETRQALLRVVSARAREGAAVVYTTHYLQELTALDATLAVVDAGRVITRGRLEDLLAGLPCRVHVGFAGGVPARLRSRGRVADGLLSVTTPDPAATLAELLAGGGEVESVEVDRPGIDDLYRALTGVERSGAV